MTDQSSPYAPYPTTATPVLPQTPVTRRSKAFYVWLIILASLSALGLVLQVVFLTLTVANSGDLNVLFFVCLLVAIVYNAPIATATFVLGLMLLPRVTVARDRTFAVSSIVIGGLGVLIPLILFLWGFIAARN